MKSLLIALIFSSLSGGCKILPHTMRSDLKGQEIFTLVEEGSIRFVRFSTGTSGELSFSLKGSHNCRTDYWSDDPNGKPPAGSPLTVNCPNDGKTTAIKLVLDGLTIGTPLTMRITVWPKAMNALSGFSLELKEALDSGGKVQTSFLIVSRYVGPRNSNEIYSVQLPKVMSLSEVEEKLITSYDQDEAVVCSDTTGAQSEPPFPRSMSIEDQQKRPLHGLSDVSTDGFGRTAATPHPFFATRLVQFYEGVDRQQNWIWNFKWEGAPVRFEVFQPGYIANLSTVDAENATVVIKNRSLGNVLPVVEAGSKAMRFIPSILFPTKISRYDLTLKTADGSRTVLRCRYSVDQDSLAIPEAYYQKLTAGEYLATLVFETNQIHYKDGAAYPPWLITAQDWINFKIIKKM